MASKTIQAMGLLFCCFKPQVAAPAVIKPLFDYEEKGVHPHAVHPSQMCVLGGGGRQNTQALVVLGVAP